MTGTHMLNFEGIVFYKGVVNLDIPERERDITILPRV